METNTKDQINPRLSSTSDKIKSVEIKLLVRRWRSSGQTQKAFCEENNLNYNTFISWLNKSKKGKTKKNKAVSPAKGFAEVKVKATISPFVQLNLKDGLSVSIFHSVSADFLRSLIYR